MKQKPNRLISRAAMMLLMMLLTAATAWASDYTATYQARFVHTSGSLYSISLERVGNSSLKAYIATSSSSWSGGYNVCVDDEYDITFTPSSTLSVVTDPLSSVVFNMSSGNFTAKVANSNSYYIKQVRLLNGSIATGTGTAAAPNSKSATVSGSSIRFNYIEVTLTDDFYGTITTYNNLTIGTAASLTYNSTNYYKSGTTITMNAPANHLIDEAQGNINASIAADKRSYTFEMPKQNVSLGATTSEVHTISCPSGLTVSTPYFTYNSAKYYKKGETYTLTADADKAIASFTASGAAGSSVASDKLTATVTIGSSDVTVTATFQTISGTTSDGLSWSLAQDDSDNYTRLTISGTGAMTNYNYTTDGQSSTWRTNAPWGWHLTSVTVGNGVTSIGTQAFIGCQSLATVTLGTGVTTIGNNAFDHCDDLTQITLPASVTTLNNAAFKNCPRLERLDIEHNGAVTLGSNVFQNCGALQYIVFSSPEAEQANATSTTSTWSNDLVGKFRVKLGNQLFTVTTEGGSAAYKIATADDLRNLAAAVNAGNNGSGKTFRQTAHIDFDNTKDNNHTPIGNASHAFSGTYDGLGNTISGIRIKRDGSDYQGIFGYISGGTVQGITLTDADITGFDCIGGIVGFSSGTVSDCHVAADVYIRAVMSNTKYHGGIVGRIYGGIVSDCTSAATLTNNGSGKYYGGIAGENEKKLLHNFAVGAVVPSTSDNSHGAICGKNNGNNVTLQNNYYNACRVASNDVTATGVGCNNADVTSKNGAVPVFRVTLADGITCQTEMADNRGLSYDGNDYWFEGVELTLVLPELGEAPEGYQNIYTTTAGTLNGTKLTVGNADATVMATQTAIPWDGDGDYYDPYVIRYPSQLDLLAQRVNSGTGDDDAINGYYDKYFELGADITYSHKADNEEGADTENNYTAIGNPYNYRLFEGHFDGQGHTISGIRICKDSLSYQGLFSQTENTAVIRNIILDDARITGLNDIGGIVGENNGSVSGCVVTNSTIITSSYGALGAICGRSSDGYLDQNYYYASTCIRNDTIYTTGIGCNLEDITDGAIPLPVLRDNEDNIAAITLLARYGNQGHPNGYPVLLEGRTLYKDGDWNTLCLPFNVNNFSGTPLEGATVKELDVTGTYFGTSEHKTGLVGTTLNLYFKNAYEIVAGRPYLVKWEIDTEGTEGTEDTELKDPIFRGVTVRNDSTAVTSQDGAVSFRGSYSPVTLAANDRSVLYLGAENTLYWPSADVTMGAFRAYFQLNDGLTVGDIANGVREFKLNFGDDEGTTNIDSTTNLTNYTNSAGAWYSLDGRKLDGRPTKKGVYVRNGKKIVVK